MLMLVPRALTQLHGAPQNSFKILSTERKRGKGKGLGGLGREWGLPLPFAKFALATHSVGMVRDHRCSARERRDRPTEETGSFNTQDGDGWCK